MSSPRYHALKVRSVVQETGDSRSIVFDVPAELSTSFAYRPGQFLTLRLPVNGRRLLRCYSMSSAPGIYPQLQVTVKQVAGGLASNWLCSQVKAGDSIEVMAPAGVFTPRSLTGDLLLFGGGSGITPVYSILRSALKQGTGRIRLIYANRDERSVIFGKELAELGRTHPDRLQVIHWLDSVQGTPSVPQLAELARGWETAGAWICGPGPFMDAAVDACASVGMADEQVHVERFRSLPDEADEASPAAPPATPQAPAAPAVESSAIDIELDGTTHHVTCSGSETILAAALRAGIEIPRSCEAGLCAACMCQVKSGSVDLLHNEALDAKDLAKGWVLCCQAVPTSSQVHVKFPG